MSHQKNLNNTSVKDCFPLFFEGVRKNNFRFSSLALQTYNEFSNYYYINSNGEKIPFRSKTEFLNYIVGVVQIMSIDDWDAFCSIPNAFYEEEKERLEDLSNGLRKVSSFRVRVSCEKFNCPNCKKPKSKIKGFWCEDCINEKYFKKEVLKNDLS